MLQIDGLVCRSVALDEREEVMLTRLGNVLYWLGCAAAVLFGGVAIFAGLMTDKANGFIFILFALMAAGCWVIGWACRYVLAER